MKKVVIIGGGFCGSKCARILEKNFDVTLIDNKPYFEFTPGILRTILEPKHSNKIQLMHEDYLKKGKLEIGEVIEVTKSEVKLKNKNINFDYLIISTGSTYSPPIKDRKLILATRAKELVKYHEILEKANKILIVGGGLVGVELAAEICTHYKNKKVTIINSNERIISRNHSKAIDKADKFLMDHGVVMINNQRFIGKVGSKFVTNIDTRIEADIAFMCTGIKLNSELMKKHFKNKLNMRNQVLVNKYLQMENENNIFCGGDIAGIKEEKTAQTAEKHADVIIKNINNLDKKNDLIEYKGKVRPMLISLGKYNGIIDNGSIVIGGIIPAMLKWLVEKKTMVKYGKWI